MPQTTVIRYRFSLPEGTREEFSVQLSLPTLAWVPPDPCPVPPDWARLEVCQCSNCPLSADQHPHCPVANNLSPVIDAFSRRVSFEEVDVEVHTERRTYTAHCSLQAALSSLVGLIMVTSGCPVLDKLRPMAYTHLPLAGAHETTYRAVSMYLLAQYFAEKRGQKPDWQLGGLLDSYQQVQLVNRAFVERLASIPIDDASVNAVIRLDCLAEIASFSLSQDWWEEIEPIFTPYLDEHASD